MERQAGFDELKEERAHGNVMFPFGIYEIDTPGNPGERLNCHWHDEMELFAVTRGEAEFSIDNRSYHVSEGGVIFINSNCLHSARASADVKFSYFAVVFGRTLLQSYVDDSIQQKYIDPVTDRSINIPEYMSPENDGTIKCRQILDEIRSIYEENSTGSELRIKARLYEIWYLLISQPAADRSSFSKKNDRRTEEIKSIMEYIQKNYSMKLRLPDIAETFGISEGQLCRFFRSMTQMSVVEYINYYRISRSTELLRTTDDRIGLIAGMSGFDNISYYNRLFKEYMHVTPGRFRKMNDCGAMHDMVN